MDALHVIPGQDLALAALLDLSQVAMVAKLVPLENTLQRLMVHHAILVRQEPIHQVLDILPVFTAVLAMYIIVIILLVYLVRQELQVQLV